ncbi:MAG: sulfotransferase [Alphaproteobacteria bacterium]|nr:sulfotransferase [Alphaproteobacteria bacterium]
MRIETTGPDFICVGMPKAGTGWLFDQLDSHPDFWMPPVKELLYLNQSMPRLSFLDQRSRRAVDRTASEPGGKIGERVLRRELIDPRDIGFVQYAESIRGEPRSMDRYAGLFRFKENLLSGDITPPYWSLEYDVMASVAEHFPVAKILLLVRDPVARAWSRISVFHRSGKFDAQLLEDASQFAAFVRRSRKAGGARATQIAQSWLRHVPQSNFRAVLFDDIENQPDIVLRDVLAFLGADPDKRRADVPPDYNRKAGDRKLTMTGTARAVLAEHFKDELLACANVFGGRASEWPSRYGFDLKS